MLKRLRTTGYRGDTIIEVMIVLTVLGLALSISYATANRSLLNARQAQETTVATELVHSQLEALRVLAGKKDPPVSHDVFRPDGFCIDETVADYSLITTPDPACQRSELYSLEVLYCGNSNGDPLCSGLTGANTDTFIVQASWEDIRTGGEDTVQVVYRAHAPPP